MWFGGNGVVRYENGASAVSASAEGLRSDEVRAIYAFADRTWVGTYGGGLQSIERTGGSSAGANARASPTPFVTSLHHDSTDTLWIGTYGGGLFRLQRRQGVRPSPRGTVCQTTWSSTSWKTTPAACG